MKYFRIGLELLDKNKRPIEHLEYEEETDLDIALDLYSGFITSDKTAKYISVVENDTEILLNSLGYKEV